MVDVIKATLGNLAWLHTLGLKMVRLTPGPVTGAVIFTMAAQVLIVLAFLLPLKVVLLVAGDGVPGFLAAFVTKENKDQYVLLFAVAALGCYAGYHLSQKITQYFISKGAGELLNRAKKLHLFDRQEEVGQQGYTRFVEAVSSVALIVIWMAAGVWVNPVIFYALLLFVVVGYLMVAMVLQMESRFKPALEKTFVTNPAAGAGIFSSVNFLLVFILLILQFLGSDELGAVGDLLGGDSLSPIIAIVTIILMRQILQRGTALVGNLGYLARNRLRLMPLFFPSIKYLPVTDNKDDFIDSLLPERRDSWLGDCLGDIAGEAVRVERSRWLDAAGPGLVHLDINTSGGGWFAKYYSHRQQLKAAHEEQLFAWHPDDIPGTLRYRGESFLENNRLLVFEGVPMEAMPDKQWQARAFDLLFDIWTVTLGGDLVEAYLRTHSLLPERLNEKPIDQLRAAVEGAEEEKALDVFQSEWPAVRARAEELPLVLRNPAATAVGSWVLGPEEEPICLYWNNWSIEPIGCDPLLLKFDEGVIEEALEGLRARTGLDGSVGTNDLQLVARLVLLETALHQNNLRQGVEVLNKLVEGWNVSEPGTAHVS
ncbi:hypothetical protein [Salinisphaera orenii]|uniref:hypothetical protein n=1 Tax=Salinisphaera orenii TaxID=856731 RepID=UPI0013A62D5B